MSKMDLFLSAMNNGLGMSYIKEKGHNMEKQDLIDIASELIYAIEEADILNIDRKEIFSIATENLKEE